jgi:hypothetical protein
MVAKLTVWTIRTMRTGLAIVALMVVLAGATGSAARSSAVALTPVQVIAKFKATTGGKLLVDRRATYPGHFTALGVVQSISNIGRYGRFTIYVVTSGSEDDVTQLLADGHTGVLGTPGPANIYWEEGSTLQGDRYWLAKKRYGANLVLWWYGSTSRVDATFKRLHKALLAMTAVTGS